MYMNLYFTIEYHEFVTKVTNQSDTSDFQHIK